MYSFTLMHLSIYNTPDRTMRVVCRAQVVLVLNSLCHLRYFLRCVGCRIQNGHALFVSATENRVTLSCMKIVHAIYKRLI